MAAQAPKQGGGSRILLTLGLATAGGVGYYLYSAGGNPKVAEKQFEHDISKLSSKAKDEIPGRGKEAKTSIKLHAQEAGAKFDDAVDRARDATSKIDRKLDGYRQDAEKKIGSGMTQAREGFNTTVDKFDKNVEKGAAEAKGWFGGLFGGK